MALDTYRSKRDFDTTPEPRGSRARKKGNSFVIRKHAARRLHYDFRLEMDGVLKSWAVTRGPSLDPGEKRLAVHVEDHPLDYGEFEGNIPKGEYGGGSVMLWDRGIWTPIGDAAKAYAKGHLEFELAGEKLSGRWHLVRMRSKRGEKRENWLLIKGDDEFARSDDGSDILDEQPESVKTGRTMDAIADDAPPAKPARRKAASRRKAPAGGDGAPLGPSAIKGAKKARMPGFVEPMLASLVSSAPAAEDWLHEIKFDGYRLQARVEDGQVRLLTRTGLDWTERFGDAVPAALKALPLHSAILDGELVVEGNGGASDFSALQADLSEGRSDRFLFYLFDLLYLDGHDLRPAPLVERKALLERLLGEGEGGDASEGILRYSAHFEESGALVLSHACRLSLEGIVSKRRDAPYRGGRGRNWVKSKCSARQEFVIAGYTPSSTGAKAVGSLVLGAYDGKALQHVGRVGTGFTRKAAEDLFRRLEALRVPDSPFAAPLTAQEARQIRHVRPELVAEMEFRAWTADGHLRHASFRGIREDKPAEEIVRESPGPSARRQAAPPRRTVKLTHPDRVYWPGEGVTKEGLADYYAEIWSHVAPFVVGRPLALLRCPNGIDGPKFFQKHAWKGLNANIRQVRDPKDAEGEPLIAIEDLDGLMGLVQSAALEIHPWGSTLADWERPDMIVMDLDPGEGVAWQAVLDAAEEVRQRLAQAGLAPFVKTSGGKGLHVVAPLKPKADWPAAKAFTKALADAMAADSPKLYVSTISKAKRRGKILIDYLRNQRGATAVAAYSSRARPGAAVSAPLRWDELGPEIGPAHFTVETMPARLAALDADPWEGFHAAAVPLEAPKPKRRRAAKR